MLMTQPGIEPISVGLWGGNDSCEHQNLHFYLFNLSKETDMYIFILNNVM